MRSIDARRVRSLASGVLLLLCAACVPVEVRDPDAVALGDTLRARIEAAYDFTQPDVVERMLGLYPGQDIVSASDGFITASADSLRAGIRSFWNDVGRNMRDAVWRWEEVHVRPLGRDAAVLTGTWTIPHIAPAGNPHVLAGAWTAVFRRIDGEWLIVHEHLSTPRAVSSPAP